MGMLEGFLLRPRKFSGGELLNFTDLKPQEASNRILRSPTSLLGCPRKLVNGLLVGYNHLTNHLLTSWDIQVILFGLFGEYNGGLLLFHLDFCFLGGTFFWGGGGPKKRNTSYLFTCQDNLRVSVKTQHLAVSRNHQSNLESSEIW